MTSVKCAAELNLPDEFKQALLHALKEFVFVAADQNPRYENIFIQCKPSYFTVTSVAPVPPSSWSAN